MNRLEITIIGFLMTLAISASQAAQNPKDYLRINDLALTDPGHEVVTIYDIFASGEVFILKEGSTKPEKATSNLIPATDGLDDVWEGKLALTSSGQVVRVKAVFGDGHAQVKFASGATAIEKGLIPEVWKLGDRMPWQKVLTADNREWTITAVFKNGKILGTSSSGEYAFIQVVTAISNKLSLGLYPGGKALTASGKVVEIDTLYEDGRAKVVFSDGTKAIVSGVHGESDGLNGFHSGEMAVAPAPSEERFTVRRVFDNGSVLVSRFDDTSGAQSLVTGLVPEVTLKDGVSAGSRALTVNGQEVYVYGIFSDGRAVVQVDSLSPVFFAKGLVAESNGTNGLYSGRRALVPGGAIVTVNRVYADGRASYFDPMTQTTRVRSDLSPSSGY